MERQILKVEEYGKSHFQENNLKEVIPIPGIDFKYQFRGFLFNFIYKL